MVDLDLGWIRNQFPALSQQINGQPVIFFDGPGGTQVPSSVIDAIAEYLVKVKRQCSRGFCHKSADRCTHHFSSCSHS
jgi:selenocysteine lyase/cysteine desulfurase